MAVENGFFAKPNNRSLNVSNCRRGKGFVNKSAMLSFVGIFSRSIVFPSFSCRKLCFIAICLHLSDPRSFFEISIVDWLSQ